MKLTTLELVYCQQRKREAIFEKIVIPITVVESSVTCGYKGAFGDLHIILGYSCASATSYKEWKDLSEECSYGHETCDKNEGHCMHSFHDKEQINRKVNKIPNMLRHEFTQSSRINSKNRILNSPDFIQSNAHVQTGTSYHDFKTQTIEKLQNEKVVTTKEAERDTIPFRENTVDGISHAKDINLESIVKSCGNQFSELNGLNDDVLSGKGITNLSNLVEDVLCDMRERQAHNNNKGERLVHGVISNQEAIPQVIDSRACRDAFEHFDLKVDLPSRGESIDFEARSQYSFLSSPPHRPYHFSNHVNYVRLESDSSFSIKDTTQNPINPFSSLSNMSFSINSDSSIFKVHEEGNLPYQTNSNINMKKNESSINENIIDEKEFLFQKTNHDLPSINENNKMCDSNNSIQRNISSDSEKDEAQSTDATLKSLESLKSFKEELGERGSKDIGVVTEFLTQSKDTQTSYTSYKEEQFFKVRVQICRALGLPSVEVRQPNGKIAMVKPTSYAYFSAMIDGKPRILKTKTIDNKCNPIWNESWDVDLPVDFLKKVFYYCII